ncbi:unnamed protein product, partial [Meganyctiphanes norvegica]
DCLVDEVYKEEHWTGEEITFYVYVLKNDVVNIKLTYNFLDDTDYFTNFYFSPSKKYSKIVETKDGEEVDQYPLKTMEKENDWVEFKVSSERGTIEVIYDPDIHGHFPINQTSRSFKDLIIRASNISLCRNEIKWKVTQAHPAYIPLGIRKFPRYIDLNLYPKETNYNFTLKINNWNESLPIELCSTYRMIIEKNNATVQCIMDQRENIKFEVSQNVTTVGIFTAGRSFNVTVDFETKTTPHTNTMAIPVANEEGCTNCINYVVVTLSICGIIIAGLGFKIKILLTKNNDGHEMESITSGTNRIKILLTKVKEFMQNNEVHEMESITSGTNRNLENADQSDPLTQEKDNDDVETTELI